jgi:orotate phosphoribosyltransferase
VTRSEIGSATAQLLLSAGAVHVNRDRPYVLAAGWTGPVYIDCRLLIGEPRFRQEAVRLAAELPRTITTLCMSSIPADVDATDENSS